MKVLFAVSNESISNSVVKKYQKEFKEIISYKNVYYFNAILKELQKDKTYDRIVIGEELEQFTNSDYEQMDKFIFEKLDGISDEAVNGTGEDIPILLICSERRMAGEKILTKLFGIGVYNAIMGKDRSIDEVCKLINRPRTKKEAKNYYKLETEEVGYHAENENDVSEVEVQNILAHYKRLGKNEERYVESFDNIASQYNDVQLRLISKYLPLYVRAVLEEKSTKYQQIMSFNNSVTNGLRVQNKTTQLNKTESNGTSEKLLKNGKENQLNAPVVIPQNIKKDGEKKLTRVVKVNFDTENKVKKVEDSLSIKQEINKEVEKVQEPKRGRGRPKKVSIEEKEEEIEVVKKKRGRPRKNLAFEENDIMLPGFEENEEEILPGIDDNYEVDNILPGFGEEDTQDDVLPGFEEKSENVLPGFNEDYYETKKETREVNYSPENYNYSVDIESLMSDGQKIVAFVGTSKNGTSFIVNNVAEKLSSMGINTALLDATKNKNSYFIYTKNEEELRRIAKVSVNDLKNGISNGIKANRNLTIYTSIPNDEEEMIPENNILETLVKHHTVVLIDCDFDTPLGYFKNTNELYLIQSMDILTIQPLTAFLDKLKAKNILDESKLRIILNKYVKLKVKNVNERAIIGGMALYSDPEMSIMVELFNRNMVKYMTIPFEMDTYLRYLEGIIECDISIKSYSKIFKQNLEVLCNMIYPINRNMGKYKPNQLYGNGFSSNMNSTLDKMKQKY